MELFGIFLKLKKKKEVIIEALGPEYVSAVSVQSEMLVSIRLGMINTAWLSEKRSL